MFSLKSVVTFLLFCHQVTASNDGLMSRTVNSFWQSKVGNAEDCANNSESKCTIRTAVRSFEPYSFYSKDVGFTKGIEIDLLKEFSRWSHFNLELVAMDEPVVKGRNFDVIVGATNKMKDGLVQSIDFQFDDLTWCVKRAELHPPWRNFFLIGTWQVWTVAAVGIFVSAVALYAFYHYYHHRENYVYCLGITFLSLFSIPVPYNPTHGIARIHFGILLIYGLLAVISINSFLMSILTKPRYQYQIHTTDELMYHNYTILVDVDLIAVHHLGDDQVSSYVKRNYELCNGMMLCLRQLSERSNVATIVPRKFAEYFESQSNSPTFCFARSETFNRVTRSLTLFGSNSKLLNKTSSFIRQAMETGHLQKWEVISAGRKEYKDNWNGPVAFTIEHISGAIVIYAVGMSIGVLLMIGEWFTFKNIRKGDRSGRFWELLDKYVFSPDRIFRKKLTDGQHPVHLNGLQPFNP